MRDGFTLPTTQAGGRGLDLVGSVHGRVCGIIPPGKMSRHQRTPLRNADNLIEVKSKVSDGLT